MPPVLLPLFQISLLNRQKSDPSVMLSECAQMLSSLTFPLPILPQPSRMVHLLRVESKNPFALGSALPKNLYPRILFALFSSNFYAHCSGFVEGLLPAERRSPTGEGLGVNLPIPASLVRPTWSSPAFVKGSAFKSEYSIKAGEGHFLDVGTNISGVKGYAPTFRLAAFSNQRLWLFEADTNPQARTDSDLLDIKGKIQFITINSEQDSTTILATVKDPQQVNQLVEILLVSPVRQQQSSQLGPRYFLAFHLADGTVVLRAYWLSSDELARGIHLPQAFHTIIEQALHS